jgi:isoquinoline 1-oxidoreductase alpha subunit
MTLSVNGSRRTVDVDPNTPLLWVLRDSLGLTGTKYGCGIGECGACTVLIDGSAERSCEMPVRETSEVRITTIEGLSPDGSHPLQQAWIAEQVPQCGYCQPGMLMAAASLLGDGAAPSEAQIASEIENICVCGTYQRVSKAIVRAAGTPR